MAQQITISVQPGMQQQPGMMMQQQPMMMQPGMMMQQQPMMMQPGMMMMQPGMQPGMMMQQGNFTVVQHKWGMEKLAEKKGIFVKQKFELLEALSGCETENKYLVYGTDKNNEKKGRPIFKAKEKSGFCARQCLNGDCRPFNMDVRNEDNLSDEINDSKFLWLERPCTCTFYCLNRPFMDVKLVEKEAQEHLGKVTNPWTCYDLQMDVTGPNDELKYKIIGSCCQLGLWCKWPCEPCQHIHFDIQNPNNDVIGTLDKTSQGCLKAAVGDSDNFTIDFPDGATPKDKALLLAATLMMDFRYFEEKPNQNSSSF